jgi:predicted dehydrogenase
LTSIGIIGCGYWGPNLVRNFHGLPHARVLTVSDLRPGRLEFIRENYPDVETTDSHQSIIDDPRIDAVVVVTPVTTHREIAEQALLAGKHVFVEKPLAHTAADAWALVDLAKRQNRILAVGHIFQFAPGVRRIEQELRAGRLGDVHHLSATRINLGPPKTTVDVVWDLAPHDLSIVLHLLGEMPDSIVATGASFQWQGLVDNAHINLGFPSGATAHIHVSWLSSNKTRLVQLFGENGTIVYDEMLALDGKVKFFDRGVDNRIDAKDTDAVALSYSTGDIHILGLEQHEPLRLECSEFVRAITTGTPPVNDGIIGARVVELLERISAQIRAGGTVTGDTAGVVAAGLG